MSKYPENKIAATQGGGRRDFLKCMAWAGAGVLWAVSGGVPRTVGLIGGGLVGGAFAAEAIRSELTFVQISDTHIGFHQAANPNPAVTLGEAIAKIKALSMQSAFLVHTGDINHSSKEEEWDTADQIMKGVNKEVFYILGEHVFHSAALDPSDRFSYTFAQSGEFTYHCTLHPMMVGKIVVKPPAHRREVVKAAAGQPGRRSRR